MQSIFRLKLGWKLLALLCAAMYVKPIAMALFLPSRFGWLLFFEGLLGVLWLAALFAYGFTLPALPKRLWQATALPTIAVTAYSLASFLGYGATRLAIIQLDGLGIVATLAEMLAGAAFAFATLVPVWRLAEFKLRKNTAEASPIS